MSGDDEYNRVSRVLEEEFAKMPYLTQVHVERLAHGSVRHDLQLEVFLRDVSRDNPMELTYSAWTVLYVHGVKHDLGITKFRYSPRPLENHDDVMDHAVAGWARDLAGHVSGVLFRDTGRR
jgi:hypothetical protein